MCVKRKIHIKSKDISKSVELLLNKKVKKITCIKSGDFTAVYRCVLYDDYRGKNSFIVKVCKEPLDVEVDVYQLVNTLNPKISPYLYGYHQSGEYKLLILEDISNLFFEIDRRSLLNILVKLLKFHEHFANNNLLEAVELPEKEKNKTLKQTVQEGLSEILQEYSNYSSIILLILKNVDELIDENIMCRQTLVHGDLYLDNILYYKDFYIIDWGFAHIGFEYVDIATLFEKNPRKNYGLNLTMEEKIEIYCEAYKLVKGYEISSKQAIYNLMCGDIISKVNFLKWILFRIKNNHWNGNSSKIIKNLLEDLLACTVCFNDLLKNEYENNL